ncbi:aspartate/glutamate racemase family protein [Govanella unica]|uniref:Aspartate/glutamate racemase family protein n=1 Tax=Govanella unica TaxID=2975056 RepID=A0A9X3TWY4_9PROT|nr:aspartate/glutamate racemase family protein [Govania unica]MDA5193244.1 aspartate/glutamate racemase family protein [Govania unica]
MPKFKHIRLLSPVYSDISYRLEDVKDLERDDLKISQTGIPTGVPSVECDFDEALCSPYIVGRAIEAEREGVDAVIVDCMSDPGLAAARESVSIPVFGPRETCMHLAAMLGHSFSFIGIQSRTRPRMERHAKANGLRQHLASVRGVDLSVTDLLHDDGKKLHERIIEESFKAVTEDGAAVILIGCTAFFGCEKIVGKALLEMGYDIPVINPIRTTVSYAASMLDLGLSHSRKTYPFPPEKKRVGYDIPGVVNETV